mgnify:FL=1
MKEKKRGLIVLLLVIVGAGGYMFYQKQTPDQVSINGYIGGEKIPFVENDEFKKKVKKAYGLSMDYRKEGSLAMANVDTSDKDYLWPSSQLALELFRKNGGKDLQNEIVFNTPIVLYSRKVVVNALEKEGVVDNRDGVYYVDMIKLANLMVKEKTWTDIGLNQLYGPILVDTTDPNESNSGNMFLGLLANALNGNKPVSKSNIDEVKDDIVHIYRQLGYMQSSSIDMFNQFLRQGVGSYPIIAGYESQLLEFSKQESDMYDKIRDDVIIMYPEPTIWSSHVYIALTESGKVGLNALMDKDIQALAWKDHGFRTTVSGTENPDEFDVNGMADQVTKIMPMPSVDVMLELMEAIK